MCPGFRRRTTAGGGVGAMTTVAIVDDDLLVCEHMQERLDRSEDMRCVGVAHAPGAARELVSRTRPDLIVLDIILADVRDPIELAEELVARSPRSRIVVCTTWSDNVKLDHEVEFRQKVRASNCGVISWVSKGRGINEVIEELRRALERSAGRAEPARAGARRVFEDHGSLVRRGPVPRG